MSYGSTHPKTVAFVCLHGFDDCLLFDNGAGQRFLAIDIFFVTRSLGRDDRVPMIGHSLAAER